MYSIASVSVCTYVNGNQRASAAPVCPACKSREAAREGKRLDTNPRWPRNSINYNNSISLESVLCYI